MTRRVMLPNGKIATYDTNPLLLHICPRCEDEKVFPVDWDEHDDEHWEMTLYCPECEHWQCVVAPNSDADAFDIILLENQEQMRCDYRSMQYWAMQGFVESFVKALEADAILPEDF